VSQACRQPAHHRKRLSFDGFLANEGLAISLEDDRKLDIANLVDGGMFVRRTEAIVREVRKCLVQTDTNHVHRCEHVALFEPDLHVHPANTRALLEVGVVVGTLEEAFQPVVERALQPFDLRVILEHSPRLRFGENRLVKRFDDGREIAAYSWPKRLQTARCSFVESYVAAELGKHGGKRLC